MNKETFDQLPSEDRNIANLLDTTAESIQVNPTFHNELEAKVRSSFNSESKTASFKTKLIPALGWTFAAISAILLLNWALRSLTNTPQPAAGGTMTPPVVPTESNPVSEATPVPVGEAYERFGNPLYLAAELPDIPVEANLFTLQIEQPATTESARALAVRFGVQGDVYLAPSEIPDKGNFMVTDGKQRMYIRSNRYFTYYRDYANYSSEMFTYTEPLSEAVAQNAIAEFLQSHSFDFSYEIQAAPQIPNDFYVVPLSPDGHPLRYDYLIPVRFEIKLDNQGQVIFAQANLIDILQVGTYGIITAEKAFQKVLDPNGQVGIQEGSRSGGILQEQYWQRNHPENETVTLYGRVTSFPAAQSGGSPFISIADYPTTGNIAGLENTGNDIVAANGQFQLENGIRKFNIESWNVSTAIETSIMGTLRKDSEDIILTSFDDNTEYLIENAPDNLPFGTQPPEEQLNVNGVLDNGQLVWSSIQYFPANSNHGGGGGGGGSGFYKLNLTGTPVSFPTPATAQRTASGDLEYTVQENDTLSKIANDYGTTAEELIQMNGLVEATIGVGQKLIIPGTEEVPSPIGQRFEGLRGIVMVNIYKQQDGNQRTEYRFLSTQENQYNYLLLQGDDLAQLENYHNRPIEIWGTIESEDNRGNMIFNVERFEIPYPDLNFQILQGTQTVIDIQGQSVVTFTTSDGKTYVQLMPSGDPDSHNIIGPPGGKVLVEALAIPDETFSGYPTIRTFNFSMATNPKSGQPQEMEVMADQPQVIDETQISNEFSIPVPTIEKVELVYYTSDPRYTVVGPAGEPTYIQPVWRFYGHYDTGDEFEIIVQALKEEFLLPEVETVEPPG